MLVVAVDVLDKTLVQGLVPNVAAECRDRRHRASLPLRLLAEGRRLLQPVLEDLYDGHVDPLATDPWQITWSMPDSSSVTAVSLPGIS